MSITSLFSVSTRTDLLAFNIQSLFFLSGNGVENQYQILMTINISISINPLH